MKRISILLLSASSIFLTGCSKDSTSQEPNYTNFKITSINVTSMSFLDNSSAGWDPFDGPDIYFNITDGSTTLVSGSSSRHSDVLTSELPIGWNLTTAHEITNLSVSRKIEIWDYDTLDPNDFIGSVSFNLTDHKSGYPKKIVKSNGQLTIEIAGEWY